MFGWFKKKAPATGATPEPAQPVPESAPTPAEPTTSEPTSAEPVPTSPSTAAPDPIPAPTPVPEPEPFKAANTQPIKTLAAAEPPPKVGMPALEIASKSKRKAVVTFVHPNQSRLVARIVTTGTAYTYAKQADGSYRLAGRARAEAPLLVIGAE